MPTRLKNSWMLDEIVVEVKLRMAVEPTVPVATLAGAPRMGKVGGGAPGLLAVAISEPGQLKMLILLLWTQE